MAAAIEAAGLITPVREFVFAPPRRWRFDFAWPLQRLALEVEGAVFRLGPSRHTFGPSFAKDCDKYNAAAVAGWLVLRVTSTHIQSGAAIQVLQQAFEARQLRSHEAQG
jgi:very-short-patch-repair endonuclease